MRFWGAKKKLSAKTNLEKLIQQGNPIYADYNKKKTEFEVSKENKDKFDEILSLEFSRTFTKTEVNKFLRYVKEQVAGLDEAEVDMYITKYNESRYFLVDVKQYLQYREKFFCDFEAQQKTNKRIKNNENESGNNTDSTK